jgi:Fungal specific transcription factor domain
MAVRIAQDLRFIIDTATDLSYADQGERRRVFWSVYLFDCLVSCGRGRPPAILDASCQLQLPCDEQPQGQDERMLVGDDFSMYSILEACDGRFA